MLQPLERFRSSHPADNDEAHGATRWSIDVEDLGPAERWLAGRVLTGSDTLEVQPPREDSSHVVRLDTVDASLRGAGAWLQLRLLEDAAEAALTALPGSDCHCAQSVERLADTAFAAPATSPGPVGRELRRLCGDRPLHVLSEERSHRLRYGLRLDAREVGEICLERIAVDDADAQPVARHCVVTASAEAAGIDAVRALFDELGAALAHAAAAPTSTAAAAGSSVRPASRADRRGARKADLNAGEFMAALLHDLRRELAAWELGVRTGDLEAVRRMRLATRRLRAVRDLFGARLPAPPPELDEHLDGLGRALDGAHDVDVRLASIRNWWTGADPYELEVTPEDLAPLEALVTARGTEAQRRLIDVLDSGRYRDLLGAVATLGEACAVEDGAGLGDVVPALVERRYRRVRRLARRVRSDPAATAHHALCVEVGLLGDVLDCLEGVYGRPARRLARRARALEELLSRHEDAFAVAPELREIANDPASGLPPGTVFVMGAIAQWQRERSRELLAGYPAALRGLERRAWPRLARAMRRGRRTSVPPTTTLEAHGLGEGASELPDVVLASQQAPAVAHLLPSPAAIDAPIPPTQPVVRLGQPREPARRQPRRRDGGSATHSSAARRMLASMFSLLG